MARIYLLFENQPNEICCLLSGNVSKGKFLWPDKLQDHSNKGKDRRKGRSKEEERRGRKTKNILERINLECTKRAFFYKGAKIFNNF